MRRLSKAPEPTVLQQHAPTWTLEFAADLATGTTRSRWGHAEIRAALESETFGKCAYCESRIEAVTWLHVEHIQPKSVAPELVVAWDNLTLACPRCNQYKGAYHSVEHPLLNPYVDEPAEHLQFFAGFVRARHGSSIGELTIRRLRLHRGALAQRRLERIEQVELLVQAWHRAPSDGLKEVLLEQVWDEATAQSEFSAAVLDYLTAIDFPRVAAA
jgi:uncharacterized protein (TIGR02646 family)